MASFWQNQPVMPGYNDHKNALKNSISIDTLCKETKIKLEEANVLNNQNELEKAYGIYKDILGLNTGQADALFGIGVILKKQQKFDLAIQFLSKAIESNPGKIQALLTRGRILRLQGMFKNAISDFTEVIAKQAGNFEALIARGIAFGQTGQFDAAIEDLNLAIRVNAHCSEAFYNRGVVYEKLQNFVSAIEDYSTAIKLNPHDFKAYNNRGVAWRKTKCFDAAVKDFDKSVEINPNFAEGYYNKSLSLLSNGNLEEGFRLYEYRWRTAHFQSQIRDFSQPLWLGNSDITNKTILIHSEQGLGDSIQFCRYINLFKNIKCKVLLEIERPLIRLMQSLLPTDQIFEKGSCLPAFDYHCPLMSLPFVFETKVGSVPFPSAYLDISSDRPKYWQKRLGTKTKPRVGIVWQGNPSHSNDHNRSIPLIKIINYLSPNFEWISLQKDISSSDLAAISRHDKIRHFGQELCDFLDTASLCRNLDAVLSVDTAIAHLTGAIGKQVHLLLAYVPDARWRLTGSDTPWYANMILYRQEKPNDWLPLLKQSQADIKNKLSLTEYEDGERIDPKHK
jgi:tetratricopeptide (TPR) repeat protein